jgi:hypothetical protein
MENETAIAITADGAAPSVPTTAAEALDPARLSHILAPITGGRAIERVTVVEVIRTMATKIRFAARWNDGGEVVAALCLKAFLDVDAQTAKGGAVTITEADFYGELAPSLGLRVPTCIARVLDRPQQQGMIVMRDLVAEGARFCTALEPFSLEQAAASLEQFAQLHVRGRDLAPAPWVRRRITDFVQNNYVPAPALQALLDGPRGEGLHRRARVAAALLAGLKALALYEQDLPHTLVHGDCHAGNIFQTPAGPGLIDWQLLQRGGWALDVAYHINAVLPVALAEAHEWDLLRHYLDTARRLGGEVPSFQAAQEQYRASAVYGFYLWSITRRVDPAITNVFVNRLGNAVTRHESYQRLGCG